MVVAENRVYLRWPGQNHQGADRGRIYTLQKAVDSSVTVTGNKGTARIEIEDAGDAAVSEGGAYSEAPMPGDDWHRYFNETYGSNNVTWESASPDDIIDMPSKITDFSPNQIAELASKNGWSDEPLGKGSLAGIPYEQGGGRSMHAPNGRC